MEMGKLQMRVSELKTKKGAAPWSEALVMTDDIQAFIICQARVIPTTRTIISTTSGG
jgi:hypothetical protein